MKIVKKVIPSRFHGNPKILKSLSLVIAVNFLIILSAVILGTIFYNIDFIAGVYIAIYTVLSAMCYVVILNISNNLNHLGIYFMIQSLIIANALAFLTGGINSPFIIWLFGIGPIGFLYFKPRLASIWTFLSIGSVFVFAILQILGYDFEQSLSKPYHYGVWLFMFCMLSYIFISMVRGFQNGLKKVNFQLKQSNSKLQVSNEELERFAYIASHDLKSPLRNITSFIKLFNRRYGKDISGDGEEYLKIISKNAEQMHHLIEDILEYSKSNNNKTKREAVDLNLALGELKEQLLMEENYKRSIIEIPRFPMIYADSTQIKQIFSNIIENGLKYNKSFRKKIKISFQENDEDIEFVIKDNGIGMSDVYYDRIFEMFKRLHTQEEFAGTGIGLAICKKLVQIHDGSIRVESILDVGSAFHIRFPKSILKPEKEASLPGIVLMN